ncbi:hypothetical protein TNCV_113481 [Trichonephila clavipes]|nr:hypothetical protein TNCV_113481 [Trichonephila clavipes]
MDLVILNIIQGTRTIPELEHTPLSKLSHHTNVKNLSYGKFIHVSSPRNGESLVASGLKPTSRQKQVESQIRDHDPSATAANVFLLNNIP